MKKKKKKHTHTRKRALLHIYRDYDSNKSQKVKIAYPRKISTNYF